MIRLTYVSRSALAAERPVNTLSEMVAMARVRNATLEVTGALIHTQGFFAQVLEGYRHSVEELMASIRRDARHRDLVITETCEITERRFKSWMLAYDGGSTYIEHTVLAALRGAGLTAAAGPLLWLFEELSGAGGIYHGPE